jgi:predicted homoserine dehydrogenase-like protein
VKKCIVLYEKLLARERSGEPIKIGLIGAGMFGSQVVSKVSTIHGMRLSLIAEKIPEKAYKAYEFGGTSRNKVTVVESVEQANGAIENGRPAITLDSDILINSDVDVVLEATGSSIAGANHAFKAIMNKKDIVMINVETDAVVGPILKHLADNAGVVYSLIYGDQPAIIIDLYDWAKTLGFEIVAAGRGSRYMPQNRRKTPKDIIEGPGWFSEYYKKFKDSFGHELNAVMYNSFLDGTKPAVECTAVSNATGLLPDVDGMHFATAGLKDLADVMSLRSSGGVLENNNVVETITSYYPDGGVVEEEITNGIFIVFRAPNDYLQECLKHYGAIMGKKSGNALLYRYVHLIGMEAPLSIAKVALYREPTGAPIGVYSEAVCAAKKKLEKGITIDAAGGGYTVYGYMVKAETASAQNLLPIGLAAGAKLKKEVSEDYLITYDDVELGDSVLLQLRKMQETYFSLKHK